MTAATDSGMAPRWTGIDADWTTIRPSPSKSAVLQSRRSTMFWLKALRTKDASISSVTPRRAFAMTCNVTGSISAPLRTWRGDPARENRAGLGSGPLSVALQVHGPEGVDFCRPPLGDPAGGAVHRKAAGTGRPAAAARADESRPGAGSLDGKAYGHDLHLA